MTEAVTANLSELGDAVANLRQTVERHWSRWHARSARPKDPMLPDSINMCGFTATFVSMALPDIVGGKWRVAGGWPMNGGGMTDVQGAPKAHLWSISDCGLIADITGDQFGHPTVIVTRSDDPRYRESFDVDFLREHLPKVIPVANSWLSEMSAESNPDPVFH